MLKSQLLLGMLFIAAVGLLFITQSDPAIAQQIGIDRQENRNVPIPLPNILAVLKKGQASGLKRIVVTMQDNKEFIVSFRAEDGRYSISGKDKKIVYGDISSNGNWTPNKNAPSEVVDIVRKIEKDPIAYARDHGAKTGRCCFCSRELTDPNSVKHGYGKVCAQRHGLPWRD